MNALIKLAGMAAYFLVAAALLTLVATGGLAAGDFILSALVVAGIFLLWSDR